MITIFCSMPTSLNTLTMSTTNDDSLTCEEEAVLNGLVASRKLVGVEMDLLAIQARFKPDRWVAVARTWFLLRQRCVLEDFARPRPPNYATFCFVNENQNICWLNTILHVKPPPYPPPIPLSSLVPPLPHPPLDSTITNH